VQVASDAITINNGDITISKTTPSLNPRAFAILSTPMSAETRTGVYASANRVFEIVTSLFTPHPDVTAAINFTDVDFDYFTPAVILTPGEGYLVFPQAATATTPVTFEHTYTQGTLNSGDIEYPLVYNGPATENNFNVVGNPYASAIDNDLLIEGNDQISQLFFWEHLTDPSADNPGDNTANFSMDDISVYNLMGGIAAVNGATAPGQFMTSGQGFGIIAGQAFDGDALSFTNAMRVTGSNGTVRTTATAVDRIWLQLATDNAVAQSTILIGFTEQATSNLDPGYDSDRMDTTLSLFSTLNTGEQLGIQGREVFDAAMQIGMGFETSSTETANYTISIAQLEGSNLEQSGIFLIDHLLEITTNLKEASYTFAASETLQANRFILVFEDQVLSADDVSLDNTIALYPNPTQGQLTINSGSITLQEAVIYDLTGRILTTQTLTGSRTNSLDVNHLAVGNYTIQLRTANGEVITKRFIKQ